MQCYQLELDEITDKWITAACIQSKVTFVEKGKKSIKYFLNLEKSRQKKSVITKIRNKHNCIVHTDAKILEACVEFYEDLYTEQDNDSDFCSTVTGIPKLTEESKQNLETPLTYDQIKEALFQMRKDASPGGDGLTADFNHFFWSDINDLFIRIYHQILWSGTLTPSIKSAVIALLFKKGDICSIANYRPISLTSLDYRIITKAMSMKLTPALQQLISSTQTAYIKKCFIRTNIRLVQDTIAWCKKNAVPGIFLFLDFKKAFDSVAWPFMFQILEKYGFGPQFIAFIQTLYTDPQSCIKNNSFISAPFPIWQGVQQGWILSTFVFDLVVELLGQTLKQHGLGITICNHLSTVSQYADDTVIMLQGPEQIPLAMQLIAAFGNASSLKLNLTKIVGMYTGDCPQYADIQWTQNPVKLLGCFVGPDPQECLVKNWENKLKKIQCILDNWRPRNLTIFGKITVLKTFALSQVVHLLLMVDEPSEQQLTDLNKLFYGFLSNKRDQIKRISQIGKYQQGGLQMIHLPTFIFKLHLKWANRLIQDSQSNALWTIIPQYYINKTLPLELLSQINLPTKIFKAQQWFHSVPSFYCSILQALTEANNMYKLSHINSQDQSLWLNYNFRYSRDRVLYDKEMITAWLHFHHQLDTDVFHQLQSIQCRPENFFLASRIKTATAVPETAVQCKKLNITNVYWAKIDELFSTPTAFKWLKKEPIHDVASVDIHECYWRKVVLILDEQLVEFNYKCLVELLMTPTLWCDTPGTSQDSPSGKGLPPPPPLKTPVTTLKSVIIIPKACGTIHPFACSDVREWDREVGTARAQQNWCPQVESQLELHNCTLLPWPAMPTEGDRYLFCKDTHKCIMVDWVNSDFLQVHRYKQYGKDGPHQHHKCQPRWLEDLVNNMASHALYWIITDAAVLKGNYCFNSWHSDRSTAISTCMLAMDLRDQPSNSPAFADFTAHWLDQGSELYHHYTGLPVPLWQDPSCLMGWVLHTWPQLGSAYLDKYVMNRLQKLCSLMSMEDTNVITCHISQWDVELAKHLEWDYPKGSPHHVPVSESLQKHNKAFINAVSTGQAELHHQNGKAHDCYQDEHAYEWDPQSNKCPSWHHWRDHIPWQDNKTNNLELTVGNREG